MKPSERIELAQELSINDMEFLIRVFSDRIFVFDWETGETMEGFTVTTNGPFIQLTYGGNDE